MCMTCGCEQGEHRIEGERLHELLHAHATLHGHGDDPGHADRRRAAERIRYRDHRDLDSRPRAAGVHAPGVAQTRMVRIEQDILAENDRFAAANRRRFAELGAFALNLVSSPGSGKTTLLVKTIEALAGSCEVAVIEGDQETSRDADRIRATGARAVQINTGRGCHLDAEMVGKAAARLALAPGAVLMIENVGNLVCPAAFDLGEAHKVVVLSVTEGEDKPLKYPDVFRRSRLMLVNKIDLLAHVDFDVNRCVEYARRVNPAIEVIELSATRGQGMAQWLGWIGRGVEAARRRSAGACAAPAVDPEKAAALRSVGP